MANTSAYTRHFKKLKLSDPSSTMAGSSGSEYHTAPTTETEFGTTSTSQYFSSSESMMKSMESGNRSSIEEQIQHSKSHWSQLTDYTDSDGDEVAEESNVKVFKALEMHPTWGSFFRTFGEGGVRESEGELMVGERFAEGGQAELYEAQVKWRNPKGNENDLKYEWKYALKVFKKGTFLRRLKSQWPQGYLKFHAEEEENWKSATPKLFPKYCCDVFRGTLLKDGRFAFLMERENEDLRSFINRNILGSGHNCGPFSKEVVEFFMYCVALGMDWLHRHNIVHRDLKASNVLVKKYTNGEYGCFVADFECSVGVVGTGFWRAPEILQALKEKNVNHNPELFTEEADVYSYGMTCYEILTGKVPFESHPWNDYALVLNGQRPEVPDYVDDWARKLLSRCWESNPVARPTFGVILNLLLANSATVREHEEITKKEFGIWNN